MARSGSETVFVEMFTDFQGEAKAHPFYSVLHEQIKNAAKYRVTQCISLSLELNIRYSRKSVLEISYFNMDVKTEEWQ